MHIPFNLPFTLPESTLQVQKLVENPALITEKHYSKLCEKYFEDLYPGYKALLTPSCTKALEVVAIALGFNNSDEIIMPSFNFVGVGNAFVLHGAVPVFADIDPDTMNIHPDSIRRSITPKTKAVLAMHYSGVGCDMEDIMDICEEHNLILIEDNAQGIHCQHNRQLLGSFADFSVISFDSMKNISCSEGGVLLYKEKYHHKITVAYHLGTNREDFENGKVSHYEWVAKGSKFYMSEYNAAVLYPLLMCSEEICKERRAIWNMLFDLFYEEELLRKLLPLKIRDKEHNGHIFWIKCENKNERHELIKFLSSKNISSFFHYTPLHLSNFFLSCQKHSYGQLNTPSESENILRLPIYNKLSSENVKSILASVLSFYETKNSVHILSI
jgi:dTDP-4-amino-4,6-dideoxygalactose transaminase